MTDFFETVEKCSLLTNETILVDNKNKSDNMDNENDIFIGETEILEEKENINNDKNTDL